MMKRIALLPVTILALEASPAMAHAGHTTAHSLTSGLFHPFTGADHLIAALAIGIWAFMLGGRALIAVPAAFMVAMVSGAVLAVTGFDLPLFEAGIIASVFALGALVVLDVRLPTVIASLVAAAFAVTHGFAHGAEMAAGMTVLPHFLGFTLSTIIIIACGALAAAGAARVAGSLSPRVLGIGALTAGVAMLAAR